MQPQTLRVLIVDDEESDALLFGTLLEKLPDASVELDRASTFDEGLARLGRGGYDVCLLDFQLGERTGVELLRQARALAIRTPVILLTGKGSREVDLQAMRSGAADYLDKSDVDPRKLERALRYAVERHRAQEELRRSEERHRGMFDHLPLGLFRVGPEGDYLEANPALIRILDHPDRNALREEWARNFFVAPRDRERLRTALEEQGALTGFETTVTTGVGRTIRLRLTARVHRGPGGQPEYVEGAVEDLTGARSTDELEAEADCFRMLAEVTPTAVARADAEGHLDWVNPAFRERLGGGSASVEGRGIWTLVHPGDQDRVASAVEEIASGTRDRAVRHVRLAADGAAEGSHRAVIAAITGKGRNLQGILFMLDAAEVGAEAVGS